MTLEPGDIIATGTPAGVGHARKPPVWMREGDTIEVEIEGIGIATNQIARRASSTASMRTEGTVTVDWAVVRAGCWGSRAVYERQCILNSDPGSASGGNSRPMRLYLEYADIGALPHFNQDLYADPLPARRPPTFVSRSRRC